MSLSHEYCNYNNLSNYLLDRALNILLYYYLCYDRISNIIQDTIR